MLELAGLVIGSRAAISQHYVLTSGLVEFGRNPFIAVMIVDSPTVGASSLFCVRLADMEGDRRRASTWL